MNIWSGRRCSLTGFPGFQLTIVRHHKIVFTGAYGLANVENSVPMTDQTIFRINSMSKAFTGVAAMQLVEAGKLNLDAPLSGYLGGLLTSWQNITVRQILTHTSGLPEIVDDNVRLIGDGTAEGAWAKVQTLPLQFAPGTQFAYTQTNYVVMGKIIAKLTGETFASFVQQRQFDVVAMKGTSYGDSTDVTPRVASLGWPVMRRSSHRAITPVGGERFTVFVYPDDDLKIIVLTNLMGGSPQTFVDKIASLYIAGLPVKVE
ncbi:beta-lactamase [Terriglobus saanensis SP1PR4]|uniref:Beta-lactamase n=1 Tax=Terriglobus saanensis (strain ATCC BAA-1853 / DSM 23119 / SP1PR4) TaxID=401053 RepID=E8V2E1_TERSS|nr:serine hydrolase domain-containing protein [Terriglobus saanensis]ADV81274.1 beta-lactamase [Terriglobus saanensis SP1PR4]